MGLPSPACSSQPASWSSKCLPSSPTGNAGVSIGRQDDPGDALAIARITLRETGLGPISMPGLTEDLNFSWMPGTSGIIERTRVTNRLHAHLVISAPGYHREIPELTTPAHLAAIRRVLAHVPGVRGQLARAELKRLAELRAEATALEAEIRSLVRLSGSSLPSIRGVAAITAGKLLGEVGDPRRLHSAAAFAAMSGTAPIPASSGQTSRHRLNRGGNRQLNRALHTVALVQARSDPLSEGLHGQADDRGQVAARSLALPQAPPGQRRHPDDGGRRAAPDRGRSTGLDNIGAHRRCAAGSSVV